VTSSVPRTIATQPPIADHLRVVESPDADSVASELRAETGCDETDPRVAYAQLGWRPAANRGVQRVQVTIDPRGFDRDAVVTSPELDSAADAERWLQLEGQAVHSWRVITASPVSSLWYTSAVGRFEGPLCAVDLQDG
jgi:hypothetical protein